MKPLIASCAASLASIGALAATPIYTVDVQAMRNKAGVTDVYVTTTPPTGKPPPTSLKQVQLKSFDTAGTLRWIKNVSNVPAAGNPAVSQFSFMDMALHQPVQTQVLLQTSATTSTEFSVRKSTVLLRPDLTLSKLEAPADVKVGQPVTFVATVNELNGEMGAKGAVVSLKNGATQVDEVTLATVNKASNANAMLVYTFTQPGTYTLTAGVSGGQPSDYDTTNNTKSVTITVKDPVLPTVFSVYHYVRDARVLQAGGNSYGETWKYQWRDMSGSTSVGVSTDSTRVTTPLPFPWKVDYFLKYNNTTDLVPPATGAAVPAINSNDILVSDCGPQFNFAPGRWTFTTGGGSIGPYTYLNAYAGSFCGQVTNMANVGVSYAETTYHSETYKNLFLSSSSTSTSSPFVNDYPAGITSVQGKLMVTDAQGSVFGGEGSADVAVQHRDDPHVIYTGPDYWSDYHYTEDSYQGYGSGSIN